MAVAAVLHTLQRKIKMLLLVLVVVVAIVFLSRLYKVGGVNRGDRWSSTFVVGGEL